MQLKQTNKGVYFEPRTGDKVRNFGFYTNKQTNKQTTSRLAFSYKPNADTSHLLDSLVSALAVYATVFRSKLSLE